MVRKQIENITFKLKTLMKVREKDEQDKLTNFKYYETNVINPKKIISLILKEKQMFELFQAKSLKNTLKLNLSEMRN